MKRTLFLYLAAALILATAAYFYLQHRAAPPLAPGPLPNLVAQLPADAPVKAFIDLAALRASPFSAQLIALAPASVEDPEYKSFVQETGFDYSRDLDRAALAMWTDSSKPALLVIAEGRFERNRITHYALRSGSVRKHGSMDVYEIREAPAAGESTRAIAGRKTIELAFLSPNRLALAEGVPLDAALTPSHASALDPAQRDRLARIAGASFFATARIENIPENLSLQGMHSDQLVRLLRSLRFASLAGRPEGNRMILALDAECDSATNAFQVSTLLDGLRLYGRLALKDPKTRRQLTPPVAMLLDAVVRAGEISAQGNQVRLRLELTPQMLGAPARPAAQGAESAPPR
jgi:hypothetical protein